jgi:hypothetical protein
MPSRFAEPHPPHSPGEARWAGIVESGTRQVVRGGALLARSALRGLAQGLEAVRSEAAERSARPEDRHAQLTAELEQAQRLGRWHTAEDEALVRQHEAQLAAEQRSRWLHRVGRNTAVAMLVVTWIVPVLWPAAIVGSFLLFPRTSRRVLLGLLGLGFASLLAIALVVGQWLRGDEPAGAPALQPSAQEPSGAADLGRSIADRLVREADYWEVMTPSGEGAGMLRKGVFRSWGGRPVMVIPRSSWQALTRREQRALADHVRFERGVEAIHVGRIGPSDRFQGQAITVEERVWP